MDKVRLYVWFALAAMLFFGYLQWQRDYPPPAAAQIQAENAAPTAPSVGLPELPGEPTAATAPTQPEAPATAATEIVAPIPATVEKVTVHTDVLDVDISLQGGDLIRTDLVKYPVHKDHPEQLVRLFNTDSDSPFVAHSGLRAANDTALPTHLTLFKSNDSSYSLSSGEEALEVPLTWTNGQGVTVTKTYTFKRGQYAIAVTYNIENHSPDELKGVSYVQLARHQPVVKASMFNPETYAFKGPSIYDGSKNHILKLSKEENRDFKTDAVGGWLSAMQHHFVVAAVPNSDQNYHYQLNITSPQDFTVGYRGPLFTVAPGGTDSITESFFVGPKIQSQLDALSPNLDLTADYGIFKIIASPLFQVLKFVHKYVGNWGWSIILVTILIKAVFYKLTETSGKSMAKMREMGPRLKALQERYKDNREELGRATMEFYKREKINPLAGCLPTLIQMPVWMAFYWVILNSAEMRQAPFIGYLTDLSSKDPYFILPIILGIVNFAQFKLNPAPPDPVQGKVMMMMPLVMTVMMAWFPSGLALYWITNTALSILQQWNINRVVAAQSKKK